MESILRDVRYGIRTLLADKGFTITVLLTLAVCIAANTATFAVVRSVLLKPLPVPEARRILIMGNQYPKAGTNISYQSGVPDYYDRLRDVSVFSDQALFRTEGATLDTGGAPERITGMRATPSLFRLLRTSPAVGRAFTDEEAEIGHEYEAIMSDGFARQMFGSAQGALGHQLRLNAKVYSVIGVMAPGFTFIDPDVRLWVPLAVTPREKEARHSNNYHNIGRLTPGATIAQAQAQIDALNAANLDRFPEFKQILINAGFHTSVSSLEDMLIKDVRASLYLLWGGAAFVLLIGALNIANLVLARSALRRKELATRLALGATPGRLMRQFVIENVMLALMGGVAGIALGAGLLAVLSTRGLQELPRAGEIHIDAVVIAFVLFVAVAIGVAIGCIPALQAFQAKLNDMMREDGRTGTGRRARRVRQTLVTVEIGLAFVLLVGAGVLLRSFQQVLHVDPGFQTAGVLTASSNAPRTVYPNDQDLRTLMERSLIALRAIPGVTAAGATDAIPLGGNSNDSVILAEDYVMQPGESLVSPQNASVTSGYFEAMNIPLVRGRYFTDRDVDKAQNVMVVDEALAKHFWPNSDAVGKRMHFPGDLKDMFKTDEKTVHWTVVGVVRRVKFGDLESYGNPVGFCYFPFSQSVSHGFTFVVKTPGDPAALTATVRAEYAKVAPALPLFNIHTMDERADLSRASRRTSLMLALGFGCVALFLAAIGIYGVLAYLVTQRRREIGIRAALGCTSGGIVRLIVNEGLLLLGVGIVAGGAGAFLLRRAIETQAYNVQPLDPAVMLSVAVALSAVAIAACALPARRAAGVDPVIVLRND